MEPEHEAAELLKWVEDDPIFARSEPTVLWHVASGSRGLLLGALKRSIDSKQKLRIIPIAADKQDQFITANGFEGDFAHLLADNQGPILDLLEYPANSIVFLVISRTALPLGLQSSPVYFPEWIPIYSGQELQVRIVKSEYLRVPLSDASLDRICTVLFHIDVMLTSLVKTACDTRPVHDAALSRLRSLVLDCRGKGGRQEDKREDLSAFVEDWMTMLSSVSDPRTYRIQIRSGGCSFLGLLWYVSSRKKHPTELRKCVSDLCRPLFGDFDTEGSAATRQVSMHYIVSRPSEPSTQNDTWTELAILTAAAGNLSNAAHHGHEYPLVSNTALQAICTDLAEGLERIGTEVDSWTISN
jgi:hypothetical protein